jgi:hypothetical protein
MLTNESAQTSFIQRYAISSYFSRFLTRDNHEFYHRFTFEQTRNQHLRCLSCDCKSLYENDIIYFCHKKNYRRRFDRNDFRSCDLEIRSIQKRRI